MNNLVSSKAVGVILTWLLLVFFLIVVWGGWWYFLAPNLNNKIISALISSILAFIAFYTALQIGHFRARSILDGAFTRWYNGWKAYVFLFLISAFGTLNLAFALFESKEIIRSDISIIRSHFNALRDIAERDLPPTGYREKFEKASSLLSGLKHEIVNSNEGHYCGVGKKAKEIIRAISDIVPGYRLINGSGPIIPCDKQKAERQYKGYEQMAFEMLISDPDFQGNGQNRLRVLQSIITHYSEMDIKLGTIEGSLSLIGSAESINRSPLYESKNHYNADRKNLISVLNKEYVELPELRVLQSDQLNSYASTLELLWQRLFKLLTWVYLIVAIALDFAVIYLVTQFNVKFGVDDSDNDDLEEYAIKFSTDPKFLWNNPDRRVVDR